jgi:hypothetical protein
MIEETYSPTLSLKGEGVRLPTLSLGGRGSKTQPLPGRERGERGKRR